MTADPDDRPEAADTPTELDAPGDVGAPTELSDADLLGAVRAGDPVAFGGLYTRHVESARRLALALARNQPDADDLVSEAFAKVLATLLIGGGPRVAFRAYLLTTVRNLFYSRARRDQKVSLADDLAQHDTGVAFQDPVVERLERTLVARAFARLPERWQAVLWHTEVEGDSPAKVAPILDLTPNGVAALAYRARERLRQNYLREHVAQPPSGACRATVDRLGAYLRDGISQRDRSAVETHLPACRRCQVLYWELADVNAGLRGLLAPVVLGEAAAAAYLAPPSAGGITALFDPVWTGVKRASRRRSTQLAAAGSVLLAAGVALALILTSGAAPEPEAGSPPGGEPEAGVPGGPGGPDAPGPDQPPPGEPVAGNGGPDAPGGGGPGGPDAAADADRLSLKVVLEPVGALVRDRPGMLVFSVTPVDPAGGAGGQAAPGLAAAQDTAAAPETGPLTAVFTLPDGVSLRAGDAGGGWNCTGDGEIRCGRPSLPAGTTTHAYLPVSVSGDAGSAAPRVRLTGSGVRAASATAPRGVQSGGLAAVFAGIAPATVLTGGNSLLSCPRLDLTCGAARKGKGALGRTDNDDYLMTRYAEAGAPSGAPRHAAVSSATIRVPGEVLWAGLYWAGSGKPPADPQAFLRLPGRSGYATVEAARVGRVRGYESGQTAYQASADVTELVRGSAGGTWWVAVDASAFDDGFGSFGGWSLVIVAEDGGGPRTVSVFEDLIPLPRDQTFTTALHGHPGSSRIGFVAWDGDRGAAGARLSLDGAAVGGADRGHIAASRADGTPAGWNTLGTDARVLDTSVSSGPPTLTAATGRDGWLLGQVTMVTPAPPHG